MNTSLVDTAPTTPGERAIFDALDLVDRIHWCPARGQQIDAVCCSRLQHDRRRVCEIARRGDVCENLDVEYAEQMHRARRAEA